MFAIKTTTAALLATGLVCSGAQAAVTQLSGGLGDVLDNVIGAGNTGQLITDTTTDWHSTTSVSVVDLNGFTLNLDNGGGNDQTYNGALTGPGVVFLRGNPQSDSGFNDLQLGGAAANTMTSVQIDRGSIKLDKTPGVDALAGPITYVGTVYGWSAEISWVQSDQINDASTIDASGGIGQFQLELNDNTDTIAGLILKANADPPTNGDPTNADDVVETGNSGVLTVSSLIVDGVSYGPGTYTSSESFITGGGSVVVVPEPGSLALIGLGGLAILRRRRG